MTTLTNTDWSFNALTAQVNDYFTSNQIKKTGNWNLYSKTVIFFALLIGSYIIAITATTSWINMLGWIGIGIAIPGIGFNTMHDAGHGSYSSKKWVNTLFGYSLNVVGGTIQEWKIKHNDIHHHQTNILEYDTDIQFYPLFRIDPGQKRLWFHRYQHIYCWALYCLETPFWILFGDLTKYFGKRIGKQKIERQWYDHVIFWTTKLWHVGMYIVLPCYFTGWIGLIGYAIGMGLSGFILAIVFQPAHVVEDTPIKQSHESPRGKEAWFRHQIETTSNFAPKSKIFAWYIGGLNYQIEHHLFTGVSHVHYKKISPIVQEFCRNANIPYHSIPTFLKAMESHARKMQALGK